MHRPERLRVLFVIDESHAPSSHEQVERNWRILLDMLRSEGCDVTLGLLRGTPTIEASLRNDGYDVLGLGMITVRHFPLAVLRLRRALRRRDVDVVVGREIIPGVVVGTASRIARVRTRAAYFRCHTYGSAKANLFSRVAAGLTDVTVGVSEATADCAIRLDRTPAERVRVALLGVTDPAPGLGEVDALRASLAIDDETRVVMAVSRLRHEKGIEVFLRSAERMTRRSDRLCFVVAGSGPEEEDLRALAARIPADIRFVGHQRDVTPWLELADIVVTPSRREAFALTVLEAMARSKPIVASDVGGMAEAVVHGETGLLVPPDDPDALARQIMVLLDDRDLRVRFGAAGRARYERSFTRLAMVKRWIALWEELVSHNEAPARENV